MSHFEVKQGNFYVNRVCTENFLMNFSTDSPPGLHLQVRFTAAWRLLEATNNRAPARFKAQHTRRRAPAEGTVYSGGFAMIRDFIGIGGRYEPVVSTEIFSDIDCWNGCSSQCREFVCGIEVDGDRKSTRLNSSHILLSRMP